MKIRENINHKKNNPGIPGVCEWDHTVLAKSGRGLGVDATAKILSAKIQKWPIRENVNPQKFLAIQYIRTSMNTDDQYDHWLPACPLTTSTTTDDQYDH